MTQSASTIDEIVTHASKRNSLALALLDIVSGLAMWRLWMTLGWNDILQRYRRSILGPFWLTASTAIFIVSLGFLYAELFNSPIQDLMPFLATGFLVWALISSFLTEGGVLFTGSESYIKQIKLPYSVYAFRSAWSKLAIFAHNLVIYIGILLYFQIWPGLAGLLVFPGLALALINGVSATLLIGMISARFRDIPQLITSLVQIIFFVTPIFWKPDVLKNKMFILEYNPFFHLIEIVRAPMLGNIPSSGSYVAVAIITAANVFLTLAFFSRFRARIAYWV